MQHDKLVGKAFKHQMKCKYCCLWFNTYSWHLIVNFIEIKRNIQLLSSGDFFLFPFSSPFVLYMCKYYSLCSYVVICTNFCPHVTCFFFLAFSSCLFFKKKKNAHCLGCHSHNLTFS